MKAKLGADHPNTLDRMSNLAMGHRAVGKLELALPLLEETLKSRRPSRGPTTQHAHLHEQPGGRDQEAGKLDLALPLFEETLKLWKAKKGADHRAAHQHEQPGAGYRAAGKPDLALPLFQESAVGIEKRQFQHQNASNGINNLAYSSSSSSNSTRPKCGGGSGWRWQGAAGADSGAYACDWQDWA